MTTTYTLPDTYIVNDETPADRLRVRLLGNLNAALDLRPALRDVENYWPEVLDRMDTETLVTLYALVHTFDVEV